MCAKSSFHFRLVHVLALTIAFSVTGAFAQPLQPKANDQLANQRYHYQKAKQALAKNDNRAYKNHVAHLADYPLMQYLEFAQVRARVTDLRFAEIDDFFTRYPDTFLESRLRQILLPVLASRKKWPEFLRYYKDEIPSLALRCRALEARVNTGDNSALFEITELWNVGHSQPADCDGAFALWKKAGNQTEEIVWSRFNKAMLSGEVSFATHISRQFKTRAKLANLYLKVHQQPALIKQRNLFSAKSIEMQQIIGYGIQRLAQKAPLDALKHWELYEAQQLFADELIVQTKMELVKRLMRAGHKQQAEQMLAASRAIRQEQLVEEMARDALGAQDWKRLASLLSLLDDKSQASDRWQYWAARAQAQLGTRLEPFDEPEAIYKKLAKNRSFYGFLSADILKQNYSLADLSKPIEPIQLEIIANLADLKRARELWITGNQTEARAEWNYLSGKLDPQQLVAAGLLANEWGWYFTSIQMMATGNLWDQLTVRFPLAYREEIFKVAKDTKIEPTFIYAIARQESAFNEQAKSPAGALGLMQIMPKTAVYTAKKAGIRHANTNQLLKADHNMLVGSRYLNYLLNQFDGNRVLAAAAYNAGPGRVNRWLSPAGAERPIDIWIETIPFQETRFYVQNILCFSVIYGYRLGKPTAFLSEAEAKRLL
jgi:soluble lytic murein transglycosylase